MAISYVGGQTTSWAGAVAADNTVNFALTGGLATVPAANDLVVISYAVGSQGRNQALAIAGYTNLTQLNASAVTQDVSQVVAYKVMGGTPDTSVAIVQTNNIADGGAVTIMVFRGVDTTTPLDVTSTTATGTATGRFDAPSITPTDGRAWIVIAGASGAATGAVHTAPSNDFELNWLSVNGADTNDATASMGFHAHHPGGAYNPAAISAGGTTGANDSWTAYTLALRCAGAVVARANQTLGDIGTETTWLFNGSVPSGITVTSSPAGYAKRADLYLQPFNANVGRVTDLGLMVEPAATNVLPNGDEVGQTGGGWTFTASQQGTAVTPDPTGLSVGIRTFEDSTSTSTVHRVSRNTSLTSVTAQPYVISAYMRSDDYTFGCIDLFRFTTDGAGAIFDLSDGSMDRSAAGASFTVNSTGAEQLASGLWRVWAALTATTSGVLTFTIHGVPSAASLGQTGQTYTGTIGSGAFGMWAQVEAGTVPTSFIGTMAADATRAAEDIKIDTVPTGTTALRFYFADGTTQDVAQGATSNYAIPTTLNAYQIKKIKAIGSGSGSASGTVPTGSITGNALQTLATVTQVANAKVIIGARADSTFDAVAQTANAKLIVTAGSSSTLATVTQTASAIGAGTARALQTLDTVTQTAAGKVTVTANGSATLATVTQTAAGSVIVTAGANQTLATITQVAGTASTSVGTANQTLADLSQTAAAKVIVTAAANQTLEAVSTTASGGVTVTGYAAAGLATVTQLAAGTTAVSGPTSVGTANQTLDSIGQRAKGDQYDPGNPWEYAKQQRDRRAREKAKRAHTVQIEHRAQVGRHVVTLANAWTEGRGVTYKPLPGRAFQTLDGVESFGSGYVLPVIAGRANGVLGEMRSVAAGWAPTILDERDMLIAELRDLRNDYEEVRQWVNILAA